MTENKDGICHIKPEFILPERARELTLECVSDKDKVKLDVEQSNEGDNGPANKKQRLSKAQKKKLRGQNKSRGPTVVHNKDVELCHTLVNSTQEDATLKCNLDRCRFMHDLKEYLKIKPKDIGETCYNYQTWGVCNRGIACRFGGEHITENGLNKLNEDVIKLAGNQNDSYINNLTHELQELLRKRKYNFDLSAALIKYNDKLDCEKKDKDKNTVEEKGPDTNNTTNPSTNNETSGTVTDEDIIKLLQREKKSIDWRDKLILSPLTTVGNLPFRRICKQFGADVTCGEMAMCAPLLQGVRKEWALVKRHECEDIFGVQLCGNNPHLLTRCGQLLQETISVDFIDLNIGCPIDLVYKQGGGCGLLRRPRVLKACVKNLSQVLDVPLTIKTRTGVFSSENVAHVFAPQFRDWGASLITIHGRSREQRYTKSSDWQYIKQVAEAASPLPVVGNGDILSYEDYKAAKDLCPELAGVMLGRGALIKPWIFTEIKEQKLWDISSSERFDIIKKYANYGLEHWGSDNRGVENTRRFLLEWLSFLYRYVPVGLLERPPQKINERPPFYKGRDELETLMASGSASDWIKISEMVLGPVPENFQFLPKHKANSYK